MSSHLTCQRFYRYNPATNTWTARTPAPHFHRLGAAGVINGKLYVAGGFNGFTAVSSLDVYDPATNAWASLKPMPQAGRAMGTALKGKLYVVAQSPLSSYVYDPATNTWKTIASPALRHDAVTRVLVNGLPRLLATGGSGGGFDGEVPVPSELYVP